MTLEVLCVNSVSQNSISGQPFVITDNGIDVNVFGPSSGNTTTFLFSTPPHGCPLNLMVKGKTRSLGVDLIVNNYFYLEASTNSLHWKAQNPIYTPINGTVPITPGFG